MKNNKLVLFLLILLLLIIPNKVGALDFTVNNQNYIVEDVETFRDYCYYTYFKESDFTYLYVYQILSNGTYFCKLIDDTWTFTAPDPTSSKISVTSSNGSKVLQFTTDSSFVPTNNQNDGIVLTYSNSNTSFVLNHSNYPIIYNNYLGGFIEPNFTIEDIENKYNPVEEPTDLNIDFPISKEEFYVLLVLVATLIMMLFLKWCFPFKMGGDLK